MLPESQPKYPWALGDLEPSQRLSFTKPHIEFLRGHGLDGQGGSLQQSQQSAHADGAQLLPVWQGEKWRKLMSSAPTLSKVLC